MKKIVVAFDFDGTITSKDSFLEFIRFSKGSLLFLLGLFIYSPILLSYKLKLYPNWKAKQKLFSFYFKGISKDEFEKLGVSFAEKYKKRVLNPKAMAALNSYLKQDNTKVYIITASIYEWVKPFFDDTNIEIISTIPEYNRDNRLTGRFGSYNCYGKEKVRQLLIRKSNREDYTLIAYGDSKGDKELLDFADNAYYRVF